MTSRLPENIWDLALSASVYFYNRTPHNLNKEEFNCNLKLNLEQRKRFGCIAYIKKKRRTGPKFDHLGKRVVLLVICKQSTYF